MTSSRAGYTLTELMVTVAIIGGIASMAIPLSRGWMNNQTAGTVARGVGNAFRIARADAIRSGRNYIVFTSVGGAGDVAGNPLEDRSGNAAPILILDDGEPGSADQNCEIDAGERIQTLSIDPAASEITWGPLLAGTTKAPGDLTATASTSGSSFTSPGGAPTTWVLFRPDGSAVGFDNACSIGSIGTGNGAIYISNGTRDFAIVVSSLGGVRVHAWDETKAGWRN